MTITRFTLETQFLPNDINLYGKKALLNLKAGKYFNSKTVPYKEKFRK